MHMVDMDSASGISNDENPQKLKKMGSSVLDSFSKLISEDPKARLDGGASLLKLLSLQNNDSENKELFYALKRLIRGLGATRAATRKGFYTALTAYLKLHPDTDISSLLETMETELYPSRQNPKGENGDIHMGRILLCGSFIRSKLLASASPEIQQKVITILLESGSKRSYLSFMSTSFLIDFLDQLTSKTLKSTIWPILEKELGKPWPEQSLDTFYTLLLMSVKFPHLVNKKFLKEHLGTEQIIDESSINNLLKLLTDIPRIVCCRHPLYPIFCEHLVSSDYLIEFWNGIDQRFAKPSRSMEHLSLELVNLIVTNIKDKTLLPSLLSPNFLGFMLRRFTACKRNRNDEIANSFRNFLSQLAAQLNDKELKSKVPISVIKKLILHPGDLMIEKTTGTKILQMITANLDATGVKKLSKFYADIASNSSSKKIKDKEENWTNAERSYAGQLLTKLLGHPSVTSEHAWRIENLKFLFNLGLCENSNVGVELAPTFKESFYRALDHKLPKLDDLKAVLTELITELDKELFQEESKKLRTELNEEAVGSWKKMIKFINKPEKSFKNKHAVLIFYTMDLNMGLQLFLDPEMAISSINEIHSCSDRLKTAKSPKKSKKEQESEEEPEWVEVFVDLMLSLLSKNNHLLRSLVRCVFPHVCPLLTPTAIHQILATLDPKDDKGPLAPKNASDSESSEDEDEENEDSDGEDEKDEDSEESSDEDLEDDDEEEDETITDKLRLAVRQALGEASAQTDDEDVDIDQIDEEEGKRLDESLAAAFRILKETRQNKGKKQGKSAEALTHFRVRVMDLLEIYLDSEPSMALALDILVPLFALLEFCIKDAHQKPLENRVRSCLKKLSTVKKFKDTDGVDQQLITDLAKVLVEKGERSTLICQEMGDKLAECCTFLIRCVQQADLDKKTLVDIYGENLTAFFKKRDCVLPATLFQKALQLNWEGNWQLIPLIVDFAFDDSIRSFRRGQALEFLTTFYRNHRLVTSEDKIKVRQNLEKKLASNSLNLFQELASQVSGVQVNGTMRKEIREKFVGFLWRLLHVVYPLHCQNVWDWKTIGETMAEYRKQVTLSKDARTAYNRLASQIGAPINFAKSDKADNKNKVKTKQGNNTNQAIATTNGVTTNGNAESEDDDDEEAEKTKPEVNSQENGSDSEEEDEEKSTKKSKKEIKKKLKNLSKQKDKQKLKKEARELRAKASADGLEDFDFSSVVLNGGGYSMDDGTDGEEKEDEEQKNLKKSQGKKRTVSEGPDPPAKSKKKKHIKQ